MRCYYHQDEEAVGICKSCSKGLCGECCLDDGKGLACKYRCEVKRHQREVYGTAVGVGLFGVGSLSVAYIYEKDFIMCLGGYLALAAVLMAFRASRKPPISEFPPGHCKKCGTNLLRSVSNVCPECGTSV